MTTLVALLAGFVAGVGVLLGLRRRLEDGRARRLFDHWAAHDGRRAVLRAVDRSRAGVKYQLGVDLAPRLATFPFEAADARFLGHPAHFVVFDGHTGVKDRRAEEMDEIVFLTIRSAGVDPADAWLIEECVRAGRVRWSTLRPEVEAAESEPP